MNFKNILIAALLAPTALHGAWRTLPVPSKTVLASATAGAAAALVAHYGYQKAATFLAQSHQDYAAQTCVLADNTLNNGIFYDITVDLENKTNPISIKAQAQQPKHYLSAQIQPLVLKNTFPQHGQAQAATVVTTSPNAVAPAMTPAAATFSAQASVALHAALAAGKTAFFKSAHALARAYAVSRTGWAASLQALQVSGNTFFRNPATIAGIASIGAAAYLFKNPAVPTAIKTISLATAMYVAGTYFKEKFAKELQRKIRNSLIIEAIKLIITDARTRAKTDNLTYTYTFAIDAQNHIYIDRQTQLVMNRNNLAEVIRMPQQRPQPAMMRQPAAAPAQQLQQRTGETGYHSA